MVSEANASLHPLQHRFVDLTKCNSGWILYWMALRWLILFADGRYWSYRKAALVTQRAFSIFNLTWRVTWSMIHADPQLSLIINLFGWFQPFLAESSSIVGTFPGSSLHVWFSDKIPDKLEHRMRKWAFKWSPDHSLLYISFLPDRLIKEKSHTKQTWDLSPRSWCNENHGLLEQEDIWEVVSSSFAILL